ncbi:MAG: hypothetical protein H7832_05300 [Magnetococcus sp. DMHC-6]
MADFKAPNHPSQPDTDAHPHTSDIRFQGLQAFKETATTLADLIQAQSEQRPTANPEAVIPSGVDLPNQTIPNSEKKNLSFKNILNNYFTQPLAESPEDPRESIPPSTPPLFSPPTQSSKAASPWVAPPPLAHWQQTDDSSGEALSTGDTIHPAILRRQRMLRQEHSPFVVSLPHSEQTIHSPQQPPPAAFVAPLSQKTPQMTAQVTETQILSLIRQEVTTLFEHQEHALRSTLTGVAANLRDSQTDNAIIQTLQQEIAQLAQKQYQWEQKSQTDLHAALAPLLTAIKRQSDQLTTSLTQAFQEALTAASLEEKEYATLDPVLCAIKAEGERLLEQQSQTLRAALATVSLGMRDSLSPEAIIQAVRSEAERLADKQNKILQAVTAQHSEVASEPPPRQEEDPASNEADKIIDEIGVNFAYNPLSNQGLEMVATFDTEHNSWNDWDYIPVEGLGCGTLRLVGDIVDNVVDIGKSMLRFVIGPAHAQPHR